MTRQRRIKAVLFDLGNTLAAYYRPDDFGPILAQSVAAAIEELHRRGVQAPEFSIALAAAHQENKEATDFRFSPMENRLARIFGLTPTSDAVLLRELCVSFLGPIFAVGQVYDDSVPVLEQLRQAGYRTAIVSNAPWGSPPYLWRDRLGSMGLGQAAEVVVMCGDVGWRKPAPQIFRHAATKLDASCEECLFVGDELQWDVAGSSAVGMQAVLIDRHNIHPSHVGPRVRSLKEIGKWLS